MLAWCLFLVFSAYLASSDQIFDRQVAVVGPSDYNTKSVYVYPSSGALRSDGFISAEVTGECCGDRFSLTVESRTSTYFVLNVRRTDATWGWGQNLQVEWTTRLPDSPSSSWNYITVGSSGPNIMEVPVTRTLSSALPNNIWAEIYDECCGDRFSVTVNDITRNYFKIRIQRLDQSWGWGQSLKVKWTNDAQGVGIGTTFVGWSSQNSVSLQISLGSFGTFLAPPLQVGVSLSGEGYGDKFDLTVSEVTSSTFRVVIARTDITTGGWGQNLVLSTRATAPSVSRTSWATDPSWAALIRAYAPTVWFVPYETTFPCSSETLLQHSSIQLNGATIKNGPLSQQDLVTYADSIYNLKLDSNYDGVGDVSIPSNPLDWSQWRVNAPLYVSVKYNQATGVTSIWYTMLYALQSCMGFYVPKSALSGLTLGICSSNGWFAGCLSDYGRHEADVEYFVINLDQDFLPISVEFAAHGDLQSFTPQQMKWFGTHPLITPAGWTHGSYPSTAYSFVQPAGRSFVQQKDLGVVSLVDIHLNDQAGAAIKWEPWNGGRIIPIGLVDGVPINDQLWVKFAGRLGGHQVNRLNTGHIRTLDGAMSGCESYYINALAGTFDSLIVPFLVTFDGLDEVWDGNGPYGLGQIDMNVRKKSYIVADSNYPATVPTVPTNLDFARVCGGRTSCTMNGKRWSQYFRCKTNSFYTQMLSSVPSAATQVRIYAPDGRYVESYPNTFPISNLRQGLTLNFGPTALTSTWKGDNDLVARLYASCGYARPFSSDAFWACGNTGGLHMSNNGGLFCEWVYGTPIYQELSIWVDG